jgi:hypothetical protein
MLWPKVHFLLIFRKEYKIVQTNFKLEPQIGEKTYDKRKNLQTRN